MRLELTRNQPELLPTLHRRAAGWFEEAGDLESAADHAIEARDVALAGRLVAAQVESLAARGRWATVRGWLEELSWPAAVGRSRARVGSCHVRRLRQRPGGRRAVARRGQQRCARVDGVTGPAPRISRRDAPCPGGGQRRRAWRGGRLPGSGDRSRADVARCRPGSARTGTVSTGCDHRGTRVAPDSGRPDLGRQSEPPGPRDRQLRAGRVRRSATPPMRARCSTERPR